MPLLPSIFRIYYSLSSCHLTMLVFHIGVTFCIKYVLYCPHCILASRILYFQVFSSCPCDSIYDASSSSYYIASVVRGLMRDELERARKQIVVA